MIIFFDEEAAYCHPNGLFTQCLNERCPLCLKRKLPYIRLIEVDLTDLVTFALLTIFSIAHRSRRLIYMSSALYVI